MNLKANPVPIRQDASGALRVGETRVLLELVINAFEDGATPEAIIQRYPSLRLPDVYSVIAHYLQDPGGFSAYFRSRDEHADDVRREIVANQRDVSEMRARLLAGRSPTRG